MRKLVIYNEKDNNLILLFEDDELVEFYEEDKNDISIEGNIYIGKVQNVLPGLQSAFINIGEKKNAFIHVKDIMPKLDITKEEKQEEVPINTLIRPGESIVVEVKREYYENKGPKVSTHISLAGRFVVLMPNASFITCSQKITDDMEVERLKKIVKKSVGDEYGAIIRTVAKGASEEELSKDVNLVINRWKEIIKNNVDSFPKKIYEKGGILKKTIIDLIDSDLEKIVVNNETIKNEIVSIINEAGGKANIEIDKDLYEKYEVRKKIQETKKRKIYLDCGGFITIDKTEALTAIDVNSGKFIGEKDSEKTVTKVNLDAAKEIAKQLRLRDISGIVIIDFIDMKTDEDKKRVIDEMKKASKKDRSKVQIEEFTKLNLMELTRKYINSKKNEKKEEY